MARLPSHRKKMFSLETEISLTPPPRAQTISENRRKIFDVSQTPSEVVAALAAWIFCPLFLT
jgi:hypothetical protein